VRDHHFICFRSLPLLYGRVPKVANSSIKAALSRLIDLPSTKGVRTTADSFWMDGTEGQTSMVNNTTARMCRGKHFCFSFVRNPFDRQGSAYNNKILN
jgi:Sulfotransferase family.